MRGKGIEEDEDWGVRKPKIDHTAKQKGSAKWIIYVVLVIIFLYIVLHFAPNMKYFDSNSIHLENQYIPNSPQSKGDVALNAISDTSTNSNSSPQQQLKNANCDSQWTSDKIVGRCFGLSVHSKYPELKHIEVVETAEDCKYLCCELGDKCMTWQYWVENKKCNLGPAVRLGGENKDGAKEDERHWCDTDPPVVWRGKRIQSRDGKKCEWGDALPTQCHGLGPEKRGDDGNRLAKNVCERACCYTKGCTIWQQHPDRGCYLGTGENIQCESYTGSYIGGRKCKGKGCK